MLAGIAIGVGVMILIILAYAVGYGMADMKHNKSSDTEEQE